MSVKFSINLEYSFVALIISLKVKRRDYRHQMTIQKLQVELDECWDRDDERYLGSAQPETIYQLRSLLAEKKKVEIIQKEQIEELQQQLSNCYQENSIPPAVKKDVSNMPAIVQLHNTTKVSTIITL